MLALLALLFLVVPIAELAVIVAVAGEIGVGNTILALIVISLAGAWLAKREGIGVIQRVQTSLQAHRLPTREVVDGALILFAGALMLTPGFLTDICALLLLLPPTRAGVRAVVLRWLRRRTVIVGGFGSSAGGYTDVDSWEQQQPRARLDP
jgi:UPF0716 protein FxsA